MPAERIPAERNATVDSILSLVVMYKAAWEQREPDLIIELLDDDFEYYWNGRRMDEEIEDALRDGALTELEEYAFDMIDPEVKVVGPHKGVVSFKYRHREMSSTGSVRETAGGMSYLVERQDEEWKIVRIQQTGPLLSVPTRSMEQTGAPRDTLPLGGLYYTGTDGYVGQQLLAELENDEEVCSRPWLAKLRGIEGELPPGLSFNPSDGRIEGIPREAGAWTIRVLLDEVSCADRALEPVAVPVTITIESG